MCWKFHSRECLTWQIPRTKDLWQNLGAEHCSSNLRVIYPCLSYATRALEQGVSIFNCQLDFDLQLQSRECSCNLGTPNTSRPLISIVAFSQQREPICVRNSLFEKSRPPFCLASCFGKLQQALRRLAESLLPPSTPASANLDWCGEYCNERIVEDAARFGFDCHITRTNPGRWLTPSFFLFFFFTLCVCVGVITFSEWPRSSTRSMPLWYLRYGWRIAPWSSMKHCKQECW